MPIPPPSMSRLSTSSPVPPSPRRTNIPRPSSTASTASHTRMTSTSGVTPPRSAQMEQAESKGDAEIRNVRVVLRVRPSGATETSAPRQRNILVHPTSQTDVRIDVDPAALMGQSAPSNAAKRHPTFTFDQVLDQESSQADLYDATARDVVDEYLKGHNITFLAYGQTSSGKSYSMGTTGEDVDYHGTEFTARTGLIPRTVKAIFDQAEAMRVASGLGASWECRLSFLELYNEEIIDLLSGSGVQIAIREERDGRIIWSGVKEVPVRSLAEVMHYLQDGSTKRKTGETGMNATSSRSHAIFSLTLTQKRRSSVSTSPTTPTMKRPVSYANLPPRAGTPTKGIAPPVSLSTRNSGIPTGIPSAMPRSNSVMSMRDDEMVVVTSKFNMVDLAGSERLKRTAAQGERMREGISINSGLSALGNVISALSDPVKAKGHIPYRDSKLTRMLQDSVGGNALTTMIACVSPVEFNIAETLNTIKYASRARNIKNAAKINAVEAGWDDVEHLQNTVLKLRKQIAQIETEGGLIVSPQISGKGAGISQDAQRQCEKLIQRLAELQKEHTDLYDKYLAKCNDNMRLTSELRATVPGDADALAKFNETVEPVILEYEKVVNALNVQLEDLRAQLSLMDTLYEEQGGALGEAQQAQTQAESYVDELRARLQKLSEQNKASEAYIGDLENRLKGISDTEQATSESTNELRGQIAKLREANQSLSRHATEIEARLAHSEGQAGKSGKQVDELEKDLHRREASYKELEERIVLLDTSNDNKALLAELEAKNAMIAELERKVDESARDKEEKETLGKELEAERAVLADLQAQLADIGKRTPSSKGSLSAGALLDVSTERAMPASPRETSTPEDSLQAALDAMRARVEAAEGRYLKAEEHVAELQAQLAEAHDEMSDSLPISPAASADESLEDTDMLSAKTSTPTPSPSRRSSVPILSTTGFNSRGGGGPGFRGGRGGYGETKMHAQMSSSASMGHLGQRPLSLAALAAHNKTAASVLNKQRARPQSLSQELSSAQRSLTSRSSWLGNSLLFGQAPHTAPAPGSKISPTASRTQQSIEAELKFVHRVIEERDTELRHKDNYIRNLENALSLYTTQMDANGDSHSSHNLLSRSTSATQLRNAPPIPSFVPLPDSPALSPSNPDTSLPSSDSVDSLSVLDTPATPAATILPPIVAVITPSNEVMDPLGGDAPIQQLIHDARNKESSHRHIIEQQFVQIADLQKANHVLRGQLAGGYPEVYRTLVRVQAERDALADGARTPTKASPPSPPPSAQSLNDIREEHASEIQALITGHVQAMQELGAEHANALQSARSAVSQTSEDASREQKAILDRIAEEHASLVTQLKATHAKALTDLQAEAEAVQSEINTALLDSEEHRRQLKLKVDQAVFELSRVKDEDAVIQQASQQKILELERVKGDLETAVSSLQDAKADVDARVGQLQKDKDEWLNHLVELQNTISDLNRRNAELESTKATSRKTTPMPPQGPPPNMPLPPTPLAAPSTPLSPTFRTSTPLTLNRSGSAGSHASLRGLGIMPQGDSHVIVTDADVDAAVNLLPPHLAHVVKSLQKQREDAVRDGERIRKVSETGRMSVMEAETSLAEHTEKANQLARELADARKTNSKLRAHLEDARQDNRRISDENRDFLSELNERRSQLTKIDEVKRAERESLLAANQQVAKLKAQLQQASDGKVSKKTGGLKCF